MEATRETYGKTLSKIIVENEKVVVLDADLTKSTKTIYAKKACPERHFNMGIAEENMMSVAAGLAASDMIVYASSFAIFAVGRAFEQIRNSIAYPNLNVKICATHAGISIGEDGASHQSIEDIALMRSVPNMKVFQPCDAKSTEAIVQAVLKIEGPCYVRLGRCDVEDVYKKECPFEFGKGNVLHKGKDVAVIASGLMVQETIKANELLDVDCTIVDMHTIKPIDSKLIEELAKKHSVIFTVEEHNVIGGLGSAVSEVLSPLGLPCKHFMLGMQDCFGRSGKPKDLLAYYELNAENIAKKIKKIIKKQ